MKTFRILLGCVVVLWFGFGFLIAEEVAKEPDYRLAKVAARVYYEHASVTFSDEGWNRCWDGIVDADKQKWKAVADSVVASKAKEPLNVKVGEWRYLQLQNNEVGFAKILLCDTDGRFIADIWFDESKAASGAMNSVYQGLRNRVIFRQFIIGPPLMLNANNRFVPIQK